MGMTLGDWGKSIARRSLLAITFIFPACTAVCHAQYFASACLPSNDVPLNVQGPQLSIWGGYPGHSYTVSITRGYSIGMEWGCPNVQIAAYDLVRTPYSIDFGGPNPYVTLSDLKQESATLTTFTLTIAPGAPSEDFYLMFTTSVFSSSIGQDWYYWIVSIAPPISPKPPSPIGPPTPNSNCLTPTLAPVSPVTPDVWFAGEKTPIVITGTNFTTEANSSESCPPTPVTVNVEPGSVTLSDVIVVNSTTITATVEPADTDPAGTAQVVLWGPPGSVDIDIKTAPNATTMDASARPAASMNNGSSIPEGWGQVAQAPAQVDYLPPPKINDSTGTTISTIDGSSQRPTLQPVVMGQEISLKTYPEASQLPKGVTFTNFNWTVGGQTVGNFTHNASASQVTMTTLNQENIDFYWITQGSPVPVTFKYCANIPNVGDRCSSTARALFTVNGPQSLQVHRCGGDVGQTVLKTGCPTDSPLGTWVTGRGESTKIELALGDLLTDAGIVISAVDDSITSPPGDFYFVQLVQNYRVQYTYVNGKSCAGGKGAGLDNDFDPYDNPDTATNGAEFVNDNPGIDLFADDMSVQFSFLATMYVMWNPQGSFTKITVPLGTVTWGGSAEADHDIATDIWSQPDNQTPTGYASAFIPGSAFPNWPPITKQTGGCSH